MTLIRKNYFELYIIKVLFLFNLSYISEKSQGVDVPTGTNEKVNIKILSHRTSYVYLYPKPWVPKTRNPFGGFERPRLTRKGVLHKRR